MTRETKVGLLVGMGVILLVGIIVTDYLAVRAPEESLSPLIDNTTRRDLAVPPEFNDDGSVWDRWEESTSTRRPDEQSVNRLTRNDDRLPLRAMGENPQPVVAPEVVAAPTPPASMPDVNIMTIGREAPTELTLAPIAATPQRNYHYVKAGETLWTIAQRYYGDGSKHTLIQDANAGKVTAGGGVREGVQLVIPQLAVTEQAAPARTAINDPAVTPPRPAASLTITVGPNDRLYTLAARHLGDGNRWREILDANRDVLRNEFSLQTGMVLKLPASATGAADSVRETTPAPGSATTTYTTRSGDTLWGIAARQLGDGNRYMDIYNANRAALPNPNRVPEGVELALPRR